MYKMLLYVNIHGSYKLSKNSPVFWPTLCYILYTGRRVKTSGTLHYYNGVYTL